MNDDYIFNILKYCDNNNKINIKIYQKFIILIIKNIFLSILKWKMIIFFDLRII